MYQILQIIPISAYITQALDGTVAAQEQCIIENGFQVIKVHLF